MNTTAKVLIGVGVALGGAGIYFAVRPKPASAVEGACASPIVRAAIAVLDKTYAQALAVARENGGSDLLSCIPTRSGHGTEGSFLYRWAIFPRMGEGAEVTGYGAVGVKVSTSEEGRFSPETMTLDAVAFEEAEAALQRFYRPALGGTAPERAIV